jgi:hypothetical protein
MSKGGLVSWCPDCVDSLIIPGYQEKNVINVNGEMNVLAVQMVKVSS